MKVDNKLNRGGHNNEQKRTQEVRDLKKTGRQEVREGKKRRKEVQKQEEKRGEEEQDTWHRVAINWAVPLVRTPGGHVSFGEQESLHI